MRHETPIGLLVTVAFAVLFPLFLFNADLRTLPNELSSVITSKVDATGKPVRLKIPAIDLDAGIEYVGLNSSGQMDTPKEIRDVGWYEMGTVPGKEGSAVMAGHYGWKDRIAAAFDNLHTLEIGDAVYVEDEMGNSVSFTVTDIRSYLPEDDATGVFTSTDRESHLNLITCAGEWNRETADYSKRLIVFTTRNK